MIDACIENGFGFSWWLYTKNHWTVGSADDVIGSSNYSVGLKKWLFKQWQDGDINPTKDINVQ